MIRIAVGGFLHETNTFAPTKATYDDFVHGGGWPAMAQGDDVLKVMRAGFVETAEGAMPADTAALPWTRLRPGIRIRPNGPAFAPGAKNLSKNLSTSSATG